MMLERFLGRRINFLRRASAAAALLPLLAAATLQAAAEEDGPPVPRITLYAGDAITNEVLADRKAPPGNFNASPGSFNAKAVYTSREAVVGKVARRTLFAGQPIPVNALREPYAVTQGSPVLIVFETSNMTISARGSALQSGAVGDTVQVRNVSSGAIITGVARADGSVRVGTP